MAFLWIWKDLNLLFLKGFDGGAGGIRTLDPLYAIQVRYHCATAPFKIRKLSSILPPIHLYPNNPLLLES